MRSTGNPFVTRKNQPSRIFAKIQPRRYPISGISNPQILLQYLFSFSRRRENIGFKIFFNSAQIKKNLIMFFYSA